MPVYLLDDGARLVVGPGGVFVTPGIYAGFVEYDYFQALRSLLPSFGESVPDTSVSRTESGPHLYYDSVRGSDSNNGLSPASPRQSLPQYLANGQHNSKIHIAAGSTVVMQDRWSIIPVNDRCTITVYDGDPASPAFGQEITDQPNPFLRALLGIGPLTEAEIAAKYFRVRPGWDGISLGGSSLSTGAAFNTGSCPNLLIRGAVIDDAVSGFYCNAASDPAGRFVRIEDCYIASAKTDPTANTLRFGGVGVRGDGAWGCSPNIDIARTWIEGCGEDALWLGRMADTTGRLTMSDFVILHTADRQVYGLQHADCLQFSERPGPYTLRRGVIYHSVRTAPLVDGGNAETLSTGGAIAQVGDTTVPASSGGLHEDLLVVSNSQWANIGQPGGVFRRCIGIFTPDRPNLAMGYTTGTSAALVNRLAESTEEDCVWAVRRPEAQAVPIRYSFPSVPANTRTGVQEIPYV